MRRARRAGMGAGLALGMGLALAIAAGTAVAAAGGVTIAGFAFSPQKVTVSVGDTVTWTNNDATGHTASANDGSFATGTIQSGQSATVTFTKAGTFPYHCAIHPSMTGTVVVRSSSAPATDAELPVAAPPSPGVPVGPLLLLGAGLAGLWIGYRRFAPYRG